MSERNKARSEADLARAEDEEQYLLGPLTRDELNEKYPNRPHNHARTLPFSDLVEKLFDPLVEINDKKKPVGTAKRGNQPTVFEQRRRVVDEYIGRWRKEVGNDIYPAFRLIIPDQDRDRGTYGLKELAIGKLLIKLMRIDRASTDAMNLTHWKQPGQGIVGSVAGDFSGRCYEVLRKRKVQTGPTDMRISEVNALLDQLAAATGEAAQLPVLESFNLRMNAKEMMWLVRILLRQPLRIGAKEGALLNSWHPDGEALFSVSSSLRRVCWELWDPQVRLAKEDTGVRLMQCFQPQVAQFQPQGKSFQQLVGKMRLAGDEFYIEEKLDGERIQMHMQEDDADGHARFGWWSRKGKEYTYLYGDRYDDAGSALSRHLKGAFVEGVRNIILDGEMVTWDPDTGKMLPFGTLKTVALQEKKNSFETGPRPLYKVYDIVLLNDKVLTGYKLEERRRALAKVVAGKKNRLEVLDHMVAKSPDEVEPALRKIMAEGGEGLVLKNPGSAYRIRDRNDEWMKVKPEYMEEFGESIDCVIVGGFWGSGRRGGMLSSFMCGLRASQNHLETGTNTEKLFSFCKVGGGFRAEDYREIKHLIGEKMVDWDKSHPPTDYLEVGDERPDVWIRPSESVVIAIKAASIVQSKDSFATGWTLRFPRFKGMRSDKSWQDCMDIDGLETLRNKAEEGEREKKMQLATRKRRTNVAKRQRLVIGTHPEAKAEFATASQVFAGLEFCVLSESLTPVRKTKAEVELLIKENGGITTQRPDTDKGHGQIIIGEKRVIKAVSLIKAGEVDIIRPTWLFDCLAQPNEIRDLVLPFEERHLFHVTEETRKRALANCDEYGDSYLRVGDVAELVSIVKGMPRADELDDEFDWDETLDELENEDGELLEGLKGWAFRRCRVHFGLEDDGSCMKTLKLRDYRVGQASQNRYNAVDRSLLGREHEG
ncbi:hypothetical protein P8C59_000690 [Phyllachora maydis]|uniref:DNA ligase n=1 Tax=Phyllachora maydis TaxID=1825666 RepID=A0AAD9HY61_9PEZI|nr:hypothetical protein P8C59_000690 [Phyllachora maydis]